MKIEGFVKTTIREWEGKNSCKVILADCDPGFLHYTHADRMAVVADQESILTYIDEHSDFLTGVIISGGEPAMYPDLYKFLKEIKKRKISVRIDTFGLCPDAIDDLIGANFVDCVCMNIPAPLNSEEYQTAVGAEVDLALIKKTLNVLKESGVESVFRTIAIPAIINEDTIVDIAKNISFAKHYYIIRSAPVKGTEDYKDSDLMKIGKVAKKFVKDVGIRDA